MSSPSSIRNMVYRLKSGNVRSVQGEDADKDGEYSTNHYFSRWLSKV